MSGIKFISRLLVAFLVAAISTTGIAQPKKQEVIKIKTSAVCDQCKDRIEKGLIYEKGIRDVTLDVKSKIATVTFLPTKTNPEEIRKLISKLGYDADNVMADKEAYKKLPNCCKKEGAK